MALAGNLLPKPTMLSMQNIPKLQKPKTMIVCATPERPKTSHGSGPQINNNPKPSTRTTAEAKEVTPDTTLDTGEDNQKSKASVDGDGAATTVEGAEPNAAATVEGAEPTD